METSNLKLKRLINNDYKYGFSTNIEVDCIKKGLSEEIIHLISKKKEEPLFMLEFRLRAFKKWKKMNEPKWSHLNYEPIDYQSIRYYSAPKKKAKLNSLDEVDPELCFYVNGEQAGCSSDAGYVVSKGAESSDFAIGGYDESSCGSSSCAGAGSRS